MNELEAKAIAEIHSTMLPMKELASKNESYFKQQWQELAKHGKSVLFDKMEERRQELNEQYGGLRLKLIMQVSNYVNYVEDRREEYSTAWHNLLQELNPYLGGISPLGTTL